MNGYWHYVAISGLLGFALSIQSHLGFFIATILCLGLLRWYTLPKLPLFICVVSMVLPLLMNHYTSPSIKPFPSDKQYWSVTVTRAPEIKSDYIRFEAIEKETERKWLVYSFDLSHLSSAFQYGATCAFTGTPKKPEQARNPGVFDYREYIYSKGLQGLIVINDDKVVCSKGTLFSKIFQWRQTIIAHTQEAYSKKTASWINALVFGDDQYLLNEEVESFQRWNLSHLLAISGLHVGLFIAFFSYTGIRFGILTKGKVKVMIMLFLPVYSVLAGGAPSVLRATLMAEAVILMTFLNQRWRITDVLSIIVLFTLWFNPSLLFQLGFQFSFVVTFSLLLSKPIFTQYNSFIFSLLRVSFISQLAILPIQLDTFYSYNPLSLIMNLLYIPIFSFLILPLCLFLVLFSFFQGVLTNWGDLLFQKLLKLCMDLLFFLDRIGYLELVTGELLFGVIIMYYIVLILMMRQWTIWNEKKTFLWAVLLVFVLLFDACVPYFSKVGRVTMLDIGQGDTFVIEWPNREYVMIIDAAGAVKSNEDVFSKVIEPYLLSRGIGGVDVLLLTHHDVDHMGSAAKVISRFNVNTVITSPYFEEDNQFKNQVTVRKGDVFQVGETSFHVLHPDRDMESTNENSLVIRSHIGGKSWLFTGDISGDNEKMLNSDPVDVLKVAHHGSRFSTNETFLRKMSPEVAWISVGRNNSHGHPSQEVIDRLEQENVRIMRTDQYGAVYFEFSGGTGTFYRHEP
ncbi:DNA internalization-related competence protein ComEC/Rec2 [Pontibacillus sp. HMF3514]|uniref:DNA internalization-related competence protein ComEC/Rec2 n=1 Tax=Pontibacillus sp. HMF3514 TaxID=2692425 RepID=UPI00132005ED|nr:DNA internalization-related competence protein ComEC/Rec2 [Pontibacillus sp. HMF3514]QHE53051.1 DNA internalization-related competence protein ComEC/Rec2 [Pontibacillus sp. HMF3514]